MVSSKSIRLNSGIDKPLRPKSNPFMGPLFLLLVMLGPPAKGAHPAKLRELSADVRTVREDLTLIWKTSQLSGSIDFVWNESPKNQVSLICKSIDNISLQVEANEDNWSQVFYMGLQRMGFLFPHPRWQISPNWKEIRGHCGQTYTWKSAVKYHGFHLHTLHPSEWAEGFFEGQSAIAFDTIRWLARNQQNLVDLSLLDFSVNQIAEYLKGPFALAKNFGIHTGVALGLAINQQRSFKLIDFFSTFFDRRSDLRLREALDELLKSTDISFLNLELGTSEFTPTNYPRTIQWMDTAAELARKKQIAVFVKIHSSSNQYSSKFGNFNFLPSFANADVGILPHTVYLYSLQAARAPMYGNTDFSNLRNYLLREKERRPVWFYPETSYFIALDIDLPLLLTDYLLTRASDTQFLFGNGVEGQINFTTGQELGYWLLDWSYCLFNNLDYKFDPLIGLTLLGESREVWQRIVDFQHQHFVVNHGIAPMTSSNFGDEFLPKIHVILDRHTLKKLKTEPKLLKAEIEVLQAALESLPNSSGIRNTELSALWAVTRERVFHSLAVREALLHKEERKTYLMEAQNHREAAQKLVDKVVQNFDRYPEAHVFKRHSGPTAYPFGYGYTAANLHYWQREEEVVRKQNFTFTFMSLFSPLDLLRGWVF